MKNRLETINSLLDTVKKWYLEDIAIVTTQKKAAQQKNDQSP